MATNKYGVDTVWAMKIAVELADEYIKSAYPPSLRDCFCAEAEHFRIKNQEYRDRVYP